jgi:hypothetical protein
MRDPRLKVKQNYTEDSADAHNRKWQRRDLNRWVVLTAL